MKNDSKFLLIEPSRKILMDGLYYLENISVSYFRKIQQEYGEEIHGEYCE